MGNRYDELVAGSVQVARPTIKRQCAPLSLWHYLLIVILCSSIVTGCTAGSTSQQAIRSIPSQVVQTTPQAPCPQSVFTPADMRARVDCHPDEYKIEVDENTVVLFAYPGPMLDWVGPIFILHIPSVSEVVLGSEGQVIFEGYKSPEGQTSIENVLTNPDLMARILEQAQ